MTSHIVPMAGMGLLVSVLAPLTLLVLRALPGLEPPRLPAAVVLPGFVVLHGVLTVTGDRLPGRTAVLAPLVLLAGAVLFWAPVLGTRSLGDAGRVVYLFAAMPALDLPGVWLVARGDGPGGIAMILAMSPLGLTALALTWRWVRDEERRADDPGVGGPELDPLQGRELAAARHRRSDAGPGRSR